MRVPSGQPIRVTTTVTDLNLALVNAGTIKLTLQYPDGTQLDFTSPVNDSTGVYHQDLSAANLNQVGHYQFVWITTGTGAGAKEGEFEVYDPFEVRLLSVQDAKAAVGISAANTTYDDDINSKIATIESNLERLTGGPIVTRQVSERVDATSNFTSFVLRQRPVATIISIVEITTGNALSLTDLEVDTNAGIVRRKLLLPFLLRTSACTVTYTAGWGTVVPPVFQEAAKYLFKELWRGTRGAATEGSSRMDGLDENRASASLGFVITDEVLALIAPYLLEAYV